MKKYIVVDLADSKYRYLGRHKEYLEGFSWRIYVTDLKCMSKVVTLQQILFHKFWNLKAMEINK